MYDLLFSVYIYKVLLKCFSPFFFILMKVWETELYGNRSSLFLFNVCKSRIYFDYLISNLCEYWAEVSLLIGDVSIHHRTFCCDIKTQYFCYVQGAKIMGFFQYQENQQIWQKIRFVPLLIYFSVPQSIKIWLYHE